MHKIFKLCGSPAENYWEKAKLSQSTIFRPQRTYPRRVSETFRGFPSSALKLLDTLLAIEPEDRGTTASALQSEVGFYSLSLLKLYHIYFLIVAWESETANL